MGSETIMATVTRKVVEDAGVDVDHLVELLVKMQLQS